MKTGRLVTAALVAQILAVVCAGFSNYALSQPTLARVFEVEIASLGQVEAALRHVTVQGEEYLIIAASNGTIVAIEPDTGEIVWRLGMPRPPGEVPGLLATPARVGRYLVVSYVTTQAGARVRHLVSVVDLRTGTLASEFPTLELTAEKPATGGGVVTFNPPTALSRAALAHADGPDGELGYVYVAFGNRQDIQPWHGWIFELDLEAWRTEGPEEAISAVLLTTPENECPVVGESGSNDMICGGGVWNLGGPQVIDTADGYEILVATGNGELDLTRNNYAQSVLRLSKGLNFDPSCDAVACADFDPRAPSDQCMESCVNLSIPRLLPGEPPLRPETGRCDGRTFLECLASSDWDLGANGTIKVDLESGQELIVQPGKEGALYMFDARHMGTMYDRLQIVDQCGGEGCRPAPGTIRNSPVVVNVEGRRVVIIPTFMPDAGIKAAGVVATEILDEPGAPRFEPFWEAPRFNDPEARQRFRAPPSHLAKSKSDEDDERYVWVVDRAFPISSLLGIRVRDGEIVVERNLAGRVHTYGLLHRDGVLYVPSKKPEDSSGTVVLEAFSIEY